MNSFLHIVDIVALVVKRLTRKCTKVDRSGPLTMSFWQQYHFFNEYSHKNESVQDFT